MVFSRHRTNERGQCFIKKPNNKIHCAHFFYIPWCVVSMPEALAWLVAPCWGGWRRLKDHTGGLDLSLFKLICSRGWMDGWKVAATHKTMPLCLLLRAVLVCVLNGVATLTAASWVGGVPGVRESFQWAHVTLFIKGLPRIWQEESSW